MDEKDIAGEIGTMILTNAPIGEIQERIRLFGEVSEQATENDCLKVVQKAFYEAERNRDRQGMHVASEIEKFMKEAKGQPHLDMMLEESRLNGIEEGKRAVLHHLTCHECKCDCDIQGVVDNYFTREVLRARLEGINFVKSLLPISNQEWSSITNEIVRIESQLTTLEKGKEGKCAP